MLHLLLNIVTLLLLGIYGGFLWYCVKGWKRLGALPASTTNPLFSIVIPARNEGSNIVQLIGDLQGQEYPPEKFEVIIIDDFSSDETVNKIKPYISDRIRLIQMKDHQYTEHTSNKKEAIKLAIANASFEWIITVDADCRVHPQWLSIIARYSAQDTTQLVAGPVAMYGRGSFINRLQQLDFAGFLGITIGLFGHRKYAICNGANLAYRKEAFQEVDGFEGYSSPSGDDVYLLQKFGERFPDGIQFTFSPLSVAYTQTEAGWKPFINQRIRWASKSTTYRQKWLTGLLGGIFLLNCWILVCFVVAPFNPYLLVLGITALAAKLILEFPILFLTTTWLGKRHWLLWFIPSQIVHIPYIVLVGILGNFSAYKWKGRKINP